MNTPIHIDQDKKVAPFAGADWLKEVYKGEISPLGERVADMLGFVFGGIYHIHSDVVTTDWSSKRFIEIRLRHKQLATMDSDELTTLVLLAHRLAIRVEINSLSNSSLLLRFHQRQRQGRVDQRHPTIEFAVEMFNKYCYLPTWEESNGDQDLAE